MVIGISGARSITSMQKAQLLQCLENIPRSESIVWHVGDANGVDQAARNWARQNDLNVTIHHAISREPWALQQRSKQLVDALALELGELYAFPAKECPIELTPQRCQSWKGAGTWGTVAYAISRSVRVHVMPLADVALPVWCLQYQPQLF